METYIEEDLVETSEIEPDASYIVIEIPEEPKYDGYADINVNLGSGVGAGRSGCCSC
jgi:hypothetical protein